MGESRWELLINHSASRGDPAQNSRHNRRTFDAAGGVCGRHLCRARIRCAPQPIYLRPRQHHQRCRLLRRQRDDRTANSVVPRRSGKRARELPQFCVQPRANSLRPGQAGTRLLLGFRRWGEPARFDNHFSSAEGVRDFGQGNSGHAPKGAGAHHERDSQCLRLTKCHGLCMSGHRPLRCNSQWLWQPGLHGFAAVQVLPAARERLPLPRRQCLRSLPPQSEFELPGAPR